MPDRPGALGAVASRIGAVRGDVVEIQILNRVNGLAMDEIAVDIDKELLPLLLSEVAEVDGVTVEQVRILPNELRDRRLDAYRTAETLLAASSPEELLVTLAKRAAVELETNWVAVFDPGTQSILASNGRPPGGDWLTSAYRRSVTGTSTGTHAGTEPEERPRGAIWASLDRFDAVIGAGRVEWPFSEHDGEKLVTIARLADARWPEVGGQTAKAARG
jgi:hypothetical protein